ncbi:MAG: hypothetical protein J7502_10190 [Flavisolibacter sp.]|nr:hypothetical protein [Flavisolibacter sp.]
MSEPKTKFEKTLELIKIAGYILGGIWIVYLYLQHEKSLKELEYNRGVLELKKDSLDIVKSRQEDTLRQLELKYANALKTGEVKALENQLRNSSIELKYKDLENQLALQKARFDIDAANLNIKAQEIDNELNGIKLKYSKDRRIESKVTLAATKLGRDVQGKYLYKVDVRYDITNNSEVELEISMIAVELYLNLLGYKYLKDDDVKAVATYDVPNIFNKTRFSGEGYFLAPPKMDSNYIIPSPWQRVGYDCGVFAKSEYFLKDSSHYVLKTYLKDKFFSTGTFCTGILKPKEATFFERSYFIRAQPENILGLSLNLVLNKGIKNEDNIFYSTNKVLD